MRIRLPFAGVFLTLLLLAGYLGLTPLHLDSASNPLLNDKFLHFTVFFALTLAFYWVVDTTRRRTLHLTLAVCTGVLAVASELLQAVIPGNGREFDVLDVAANVVGSLAAVGLCAWYHRRMLERKRMRKYTAVPTEGDAEEDLELGEGVGGRHEEGVTVGGDAARATTLEEEVDNWDENAEDPWDEDDAGDVGVAAPMGKDADQAGGAKKRSD
ncbi:hypothetical protein C8A05DRAFT_36830 [Staphylotrichum tortipilum]|uniref:VanZ-like domain-containing protein n=1 Tax=Staphylotrichum tortipilum TaxID=2831512 RepID=A0AAN6RQT8_9PEZI|nr:hypothetical protein C8A05DRAFT_36830 [Staphylotrichum longicolle]